MVKQQKGSRTVVKPKPLPKTTHTKYNDVLNEDRVRDLAMIQCTMTEIAACCKCSVATLERNFAEVIKQGYEQGRESLRRAQVKKAMEGNPTMLIWCGKHILKQREVIEIDTNRETDVRTVIAHIKGLDKDAVLEDKSEA